MKRSIGERRASVSENSPTRSAFSVAIISCSSCSFSFARRAYNPPVLELEFDAA